MSGIKWFGGKRRLGPWIADHMPDHDRYLEPYGGGLSVLCAKPKARIETINDIGSRVVNMYRVIRDHGPELARLLEYTPHSREEMLLQNVESDDPIEDARRMIVGAYQSRQGGGCKARGWKMYVNKATGDLYGSVAATKRVHARLDRVQVDNSCAIKVIKRHDDPALLIYADPPYDPATRTAHFYENEPDKTHHAELVDTLLECSAMIIVSGYAGGEYDRLEAQGWSVVQTESRGSQNQSLTETLWINPSAATGPKQSQLW